MIVYRVPPHQSLLIRVLDAQLRGPGPAGDHCVDSLGIDAKVCHLSDKYKKEIKKKKLFAGEHVW